MIDIVFVLLPDTLLLDLAGPAEAFRLANQHLARRGKPPRYRLRFVGAKAESSTSVGAVLTKLEPLPAQLPPASRVVLLGQPKGRESPRQTPLPRVWSDTRRWLAQVVAPGLASDDQLRLIAICAGALLAADAGLLAGRRCTTHHEMFDELQRLAPTARVLGNRVFVLDGAVATSAGVTAGIDLALHLIASDIDAAIAAAVAQDMVVYLRRGPDDPELSPLLGGRNHLHPAVHRVQDVVTETPADDWSLQRLADVAHVTPRHLSRLFEQHVGCSPRRYVQSIRTAVAQQAIAAGQPVKQAIGRAGFASDRQWRRARHQARGID